MYTVEKYTHEDAFSDTTDRYAVCKTGDMLWVARCHTESDARAIADALNERERITAENRMLREALGMCAHVIGHNNCTDGKTPNGFAVALNHARAALSAPPEAMRNG